MMDRVQLVNSIPCNLSAETKFARANCFQAAYSCHACARTTAKNRGISHDRIPRHLLTQIPLSSSRLPRIGCRIYGICSTFCLQFSHICDHLSRQANRKLWFLFTDLSFITSKLQSICRRLTEKNSPEISLSTRFQLQIVCKTVIYKTFTGQKHRNM